MNIHFVEIQNFRKLKACRIELNEKKTVFVGANNSGKTSAMDALILFLNRKNKFSTVDFTLSNWEKINAAGNEWIKDNPDQNSLLLNNLEDFLPTLDIWISAKEDKIHYITHLMPKLKWQGELVGVRFRLEPKSIENLFKDFRQKYQMANIALEEENKDIKLWPKSLRDFLDKEINNHFVIKSYPLNAESLANPIGGVAQLQKLSTSASSFDNDPLKGLIKIHTINAQRGFSDSNADNLNKSSFGSQESLSIQLKEYHKQHLNSSSQISKQDGKALIELEKARHIFDQRINLDLENAIKEIQSLGYPGFTDPLITISCNTSPSDSLNHSAAIQFDVIKNKADAESNFKLPEKYNGLGYQNLISMIFRLMLFRDEWMKVGQELKSNDEEEIIEPIHLVLIEEPEAHLHAQVQQVFIKKSYEVLRNHEDLKNKKDLTTQVVISTHSSHIAHAIDFTCLRYFQRKIAQKSGEVPTASVINLSNVFGTDLQSEKFARRYLKTTHCDLFFADAIILVEGSAERMLVPHFIKTEFTKLHESYLSILEVGGSHAHTLKPLLEALGIITLIISDIDSIDPNENRSSKKPKLGQGYITGNKTIIDCMSGTSNIDDLSNAKHTEKIKKDFPICVAFQIPLEKYPEIIPYTFEDSLVLENTEIFSKLEGNGLIKKVKQILNGQTDIDQRSQLLYDEVSKTRQKAEFALELLFIEDPSQLMTPKYIKEGLDWLELKLGETTTLL